MVQGEGVGVFVFEDWEYVVVCGVDILVEVVGFFMLVDVQDIVMFLVIGVECIIIGVMLDVYMWFEEVGYINVYGIGIVVNDKIECVVVVYVFGYYVDWLMMLLMKFMYGYLIGGMGVVELLVCIMVLCEGVIVFIIGYEELDLECVLDIVLNEVCEVKVDVVLLNVFVFGGLNVVIVLCKV